MALPIFSPFGKSEGAGNRARRNYPVFCSRKGCWWRGEIVIVYPNTSSVNFPFARLRATCTTRFAM